MDILCIPRGPLQSNMYLAFISGFVFVIDPSVDPDSLDKEISDVTGILITHGHYDHIKYVEKWHSKYPNARIFMNPGDESLLKDAMSNCSYMDGIAVRFGFPYEKAEETISFGTLKIEVLSTPGHTMGSVCYLFSEDSSGYLFTGDTVFAGSVGRTDMVGGSYELMTESIARLSELPADTRVFPGHGPDSTIGNEQKYNPFF